MAVAEQDGTERNELVGSASRTALKAAAAAAATGAATYAMRKALSHESEGRERQDEDDDGGRDSRSTSKRKTGAGSIVSSAASSAWDSASEVVLPMAEDAVAAAGKYLAERAPDVVRERLVPRFIESFNEAS
jgi:hypothetical protein